MKLLTILLATLVLAAPASADYRYPGQRTAHDPALDAMLAAAETHWDRARVPRPCDETVLDVAENLADIDVSYDPHSRGYSPLTGHDDCRIVLDARYAGQQLMLTHGPRFDRWGRRFAAADLCTVIIHEEGHVRGLTHGDDDYPVMREDVLLKSRWEDQPHECRVIARRLVKR